MFLGSFVQNTLKYSCHQQLSFFCKKVLHNLLRQIYNLGQGGAQASDNSTRDTLSQDGIRFKQSLVKLKEVLYGPI